MASTYKVLTAFLKQYDHEVVEIEVVPSALAPPDDAVLVDGKCIGVSKKVLAQAYLIAHKIFETRDAANVNDTLAATKVLLLFDPEHLTAANFRKMQLVDAMRTSSCSVSSIFKADFAFTTSILTSPLHRQSKSPTLWYHRFWLMKTIGINRAFQYEHGRSDVDFTTFAKEEIEIVCKSGERHPKNYYAFQYARRLMELVLSEIGSGSKALLELITKQVKDWCVRHPSDISGWSFFEWILRRPEQSPGFAPEVLSAVVDIALKWKWQHESVWVFVQTMLVCSELSGNASSALLDRIKGIRASDGQHEDHCRVNCMSRAIAWVETHNIIE